MEVCGVQHAYGRRKVLGGVDLVLPPGTLTGVVGENGAGKTTLLRILCGELRPDSGTLRHHGRLGYCPQQAVLNDAFTVRQHLEFFRTAYGIPNLSRAEELMGVLGLTAYADERTGLLSGGTRQKVNLTLALMHDPQVLLLDEPYQGFDWETYLRFWELVTQLREAGRAVLVVSHLAHDAERLDRLFQLKGGILHERAEITA
ncbi:ABC transporter ATP-binding protein [Streptomyces violascens]|uniref:ABC transporter ATP-binding protein n=1 Tax=Streptomyces violascens TaxID=67381 RepID=UPI0037895313